jgi:uncharacterized protein (DUF1501 family)
MNVQHHLNVSVNKDGIICRRGWLRNVSAASLAAGTVGWTDVLSVRADDLRKQGMACILLWMQGGPSQFETFDPKPGHANGGEKQAIATAIPGVQFSENLPKLAKQAGDLAVVRSMTTKEGNHQRASFLLHTSYIPTASVNYPTMGAVVSHQLRDAACQLPSFVRIGPRFVNSGNGGLLGTEFDAFSVPNAGRLPDNVKPATETDRYQRRLALVNKLEGVASAKPPEVADHQKLYDQASRMILSPQMQAFDLDKESDKLREAYGRTEFGSACLLARRLVESGVTFVEVGLGNWDTHFDNFTATSRLCGQLDQPFAYLIEDLKQRGMFERTLVVWMGEFGRTPRVNPRGGRDHYPRAFSAVLAGAGIHGGRTLGATDAGGESVTDRPVTEKDLFQTVYKSLKINAGKENMSPIGRPIKLVDGGAPVNELFA